MHHFGCVGLWRRFAIGLIAATVAVVGFAAHAPAADPADAPLAANVPSGTLFYVGWAGSAQAAAMSDGTHAQALLNESQLRELMHEYLPRVLMSLAKDNQEAEPILRASLDLAAIAFQHPTALAFGGVAWESDMNNGEPMPKLMIICDAGDDAPRVRAKINDLFRAVGKPELAFIVDENNGRVYLSVGFAKLDLAQVGGGGDGNNGPSLATMDQFVSATTDVLASLEKGPMKVVYIDVPGMLEVILQGTEREEGPEQAAEAREGLQMLGFDAIGRVCVATGFNGADYATSGFMEISAERRGLTLLLPEPGASLDAAMINAIPADATLAAGAQFKIGEIVNIVRQIISRTQPQEAQQFEEGMAFIGRLVGTDIEQDVLNQFGDTWAAFVSPQIGERVQSGVVINTPKNAAQLQRGLASLTLNLSAIANQSLKDETEGNLRLPGRYIEREGVRTYFLNTPLIAPSWSIDGDSLHAAFYPQNILAARSVGGGFAESEAWAAVKALAGDHEPVAFSYADLPATAPASYPQLLSLMQLGIGAGDMFGDMTGVTPPAMAMPPLPVVMEHLSPAVSVAWVDESGFHMRSTEPFPMSSILAGSPSSGIGAAASMMGVLLPSLDRARDSAVQVQSASNLRQLSQGMFMYANDNKGTLPPTLGDVFAGGYSGSIEIFLSPRIGTQPPEVMAQAIDGQRDWINENTDYVYIGNGRKLTSIRNHSEMPIAWENPERVEEGINILFADGHVEFVEFPRAYELIEAVQQ